MTKPHTLAPNLNDRKPVAIDTFRELLERARDLIGVRRRVLLGICGPPGAGKSTLAHALVAHLGPVASLVAMDGYHLSAAQLLELGRLDRMGAPDTFDAAGFVALVRGLRTQAADTILAPRFCRRREQVVPDAVAISPAVALVVVEGNYLLVPDEPWGSLAPLFDEVWYCEREEEKRLADLITRHEAYGKATDDARRWALGPDQANAELIAQTRHRADVIAKLADLADLTPPGEEVLHP